MSVLLNPLIVRNFLYYFVEWKTVNLKNGFKFNTIYYLYLLAFSVAMFEMSYTIYLFQTVNLSANTGLARKSDQLMSWEPVGNYFLNHADSYDSALYEVIILFYLTLVYMLRRMHSQHYGPTTSKILHDMVVTNWTHFEEIGQKQAQPIRNNYSCWFKTPRIIMEKWIAYLRLPKVDHEKFFRRSINSQTSQSVELRLQLAWFQWALQKVILWLHVFIYMFFWVVVIFLYPMAAKPYQSLPCSTIWIFPLFTIGYFLYFLLACFTARLFFLAFFYAVFPLKIYGSHLGILNRSLSHIFKHRSYGKRKARFIEYFLREHTKACYETSCLNRDEVSHTILVSILIFMPTNIFFVTRILFGSYKLMEKTIFSAITLGEWITGCALLVPVACISSVIHSSAKRLGKVQLKFRAKSSLRIKLKLDDTFGRLISGPKYGMSIGCMGTITFYNVFEIIMFYLASFLFVLNHDVANLFAEIKLIN